MKFTLNWLKDHLDTKALPTEIEEALTKLELAVGIADPAASLETSAIHFRRWNG